MGFDRPRRGHGRDGRGHRRARLITRAARDSNRQLAHDLDRTAARPRPRSAGRCGGPAQRPPRPMADPIRCSRARADRPPRRPVHRRRLRRRRPPGRADRDGGAQLARTGGAVPGPDRADRPADQRLPDGDGRPGADARPTRPTGRRAGGDERPLLGVPVAVKDDQDVAGEVTARRAPPRTVGRPREDAEIVPRLRAAGAVIIGKTNLPELAIIGDTESPTWGVTRNPWDLDRTPGGSSGGSARRGGSRPGRRGHGLRRRRLDPHPGGLLRAVRPQAPARPRVARPPTASTGTA